MFKLKTLFRLITLSCVVSLLSTNLHAQDPQECVLGVTATSPICAGSCSQVANTSYSPLGGPCFPNFFWDMPGGNPSTYIGVSPGSVCYNTPGTYTITLYEADNQGNPTIPINSQSAVVTVVGPPDPSFTFNPSPVCMNDIVSFSVLDPNLTPNDIVSWDFGDGNFGSGLQAVNQYLNSGFYTVTCCVTNVCGTVCSTQVVEVLDADPCFTWEGTCKIFFTSNTRCDNLIVQGSHDWNFGDPNSGPNNTSTQANPTHVFTQNNVWYTVTHTIQTPNGFFTCTSQVLQTGTPVANIDGWQTNNCGNGFLTYTANPCDPGIMYTWQVIGGTPSSGTGCSINVNWGSNGGYVILAAWDSIADCTGYDTLKIPSCCDWTVTPYRIDNTTASDVLTSSSFAGCVSGNVVDGSCIGSFHIIISGVFTINVPIVFQNCDLIDINTNTPILINSGQSLTFDNCDITNKCDTMWDGIYIPDPSATLNIINGSKIQFAKHAVVSNNGGNYFIENSFLQNNDTDIVVNAYGATHPGIIRGTTFTMVGSMLPALPALPIGHTETVCAIEIRSNANITIGDPSQPSYKNQFSDILVGVRTDNSITSIVNARFSNFTPTTAQILNVDDAGTGVVATGRKGLYYQPSLKVGGSAADSCSFYDMRFGIHASERIHVDITHNNISRIRRYGVWVQNSRQTFINVSSNFINNSNSSFAFGTGILVLECYQSTVNIINNRIWAPMSPPNQNGTGIRVGLVTPGDVNLTILSNKILRVKTGIWTQQLVGKNHVFITNNTITFQKQNVQYTSIHSGIYLEKCATVRVQYNRISKTNGPSPNNTTVRDNLRGVYINNSGVSYVSHNNFTKMGTGIYGYEDCHDSKLVCDTFNFCYDGFFFGGGPLTGNACNIGDQVIDPNTSLDAPTGCVWNNSINYDLNGKIDPAVFWYRDGSYTPTIGLTPVSLAPSNVTIFSGNQSACDIPQFFAPAPVFERELNAGTAVLYPANYATSPEMNYSGKRNAHQKLRETPSWMSLGTPQDSLYSSFYITNDNSNVGYFRNFEDMAAVDSVIAAGSVLTAITDTNVSEANLKTVYSIYQATWMQGVYSFSPADSATLYFLATQHASDGGDAVFAARVLLGLQVDEYSSSGLRVLSPQSTDNTIHPMKLYPNPANDHINVLTEIPEGKSGMVSIVDLQGRTVLTQYITGSETYSLDVSSLENGMYFIQLVVDGECVEKDKLEIMHE